MLNSTQNITSGTQNQVAPGIIFWLIIIPMLLIGALEIIIFQDNGDFVFNAGEKIVKKFQKLPS